MATWAMYWKAEGGVNLQAVGFHPYYTEIETWGFCKQQPHIRSFVKRRRNHRNWGKENKPSKEKFHFNDTINHSFFN